MKSFRLTLSSLDRMLILRLAQVAYRLRLLRLSIWLNTKVEPWGTLIAAFQTIELTMLRMMKDVVVVPDNDVDKAEAYFQEILDEETPDLS